ncbi:MAG TPA: hypothetical protein VLI54_03635 [Bacillota bacterium]|nr:hypothetical protein [Bacillota bacterium]
MPDATAILTQQDKRLTDTIVYLASLSASLKDIDPMLDTLRMVTATWDGSSPLPNTDRDALEKLEAELKDYLINHDPLREFTPQTLDERVRLYLDPPPKKRKSINYAGMVGLSALAALLAFAIPYTPSLGTRALLSSPAFCLVGVIGVVWFFLSSLSNFKPELKKAFTWVSGGTVVLGIFFMHFVVVQLLHGGGGQLFRYGGLIALATIAVMLMYGGVVMYARLLDLTSWFMSFKGFSVATAGALALTVGITVLRNVDQPLYFGFTLACLNLLTVAALYGARTAKLIYNHATAAYTTSVRWLYIFMFGTFYGCIAYTTMLVVLGYLNGAPLSAAIALFAVPPVLLLLYSSYSFKKETNK